MLVSSLGSGQPDQLCGQAAWWHGTNFKGRTPPTRTHLFSSQPPFLPALVALLVKSLQTLVGEETPGLSCPLPVSLVLSAPINYKLIPHLLSVSFVVIKHLSG